MIHPSGGYVISKTRLRFQQPGSRSLLCETVFQVDIVLHKQRGRSFKSKAVIVNTVSLRHIFETNKHLKDLRKAPWGYNSVYGVGDDGSGNDELVVCDNDALRPAYLIICSDVQVRTFPSYNNSFGIIRGLVERLSGYNPDATARMICAFARAINLKFGESVV
ncbi:hypothetical protein FRB94_004681 [Tulasnella sp. JGI-2019a]|nr:hypothetical protein FRB94_004681 [Tulasnella sp. JGI-2019a]KAG9006341.1 hypothetical protein FRB93_008830 [Tulasnella sp. JGI-2019a]KAG9038009.1 hypothetical protein FRB95_003402 [Tulasnella sp. JGI-2019a]